MDKVEEFLNMVISYMKDINNKFPDGYSNSSYDYAIDNLPKSDIIIVELETAHLLSYLIDDNDDINASYCINLYYSDDETDPVKLIIRENPELIKLFFAQKNFENFIINNFTPDLVFKESNNDDVMVYVLRKPGDSKPEISLELFKTVPKENEFYIAKFRVLIDNKRYRLGSVDRHSETIITGKGSVSDFIRLSQNNPINRESYEKFLFSMKFSNRVFDFLCKDYRSRYNCDSEYMISLSLKRQILGLGK